MEQWRSGPTITVRNERGQLLTRRRQTSSFSLDQARALYSSSRSLQEGVTRSPLKHVTEVSIKRKGAYTIVQDDGVTHLDLAPTPKIKRPQGSHVVQWFVQLLLKDGQQVAARSRLYDDRLDDDDDARAMAWRSVLARLAQALSLDYLEEVGEEYFEQSVVSVDEGKVAFIPKRRAAHGLAVTSI